MANATCLFLLLAAVSVLAVHGGRIAKRQTGFGGLAGGFSPIAVDDPTVKQMADFATTAVAAKSNSGSLKLVKIVSAETQVVAGKNYKMTLQLVDGANSQSCQVVVFDQPWSNTRKLIRSECDAASSTRTVRQSFVTGGFSPLSVDAPEVKEIADFATTAVAANTNSGPLKLVKIVKAASQVVAGQNYKLSLEFIGSNSETLACDVTIFDQSWTSTRKLTESKCFPVGGSVKTKRHDAGPPGHVHTVAEPEKTLSGAFESANVDDADVKEMATFAAVALSSTNSSPLKVVKVHKVQKQVVAGMNYKMTLELIGEGANATSFTCEVVVFDQSWSNTRQLSQSLCPSSKV